MNRSTGFLHWVFPAMLGLVALQFFLSGRDFSQAVSDLAAAAPAESMRHPLVAWGQRGVSLLLLGASAERLLNHIVLHKPVPSLVLALAFTVYWFASVAATSVFGSHPFITHEYLYSMAIGLAAVLVTTPERDKVLDTARNTLLAFMLVSVVLIPLRPGLVLDADYSQGFIPGLPRLAGLASHPVALGMLAQIGLLLLWHRPFERRWLNRLAWLLGATVLFMAQSKTAWIAFLVCSACMLMIRNSASFWQRLGDPRHKSFGIGSVLGFIALVSLLLAGALIGSIQTEIAGFFDSSEGAQLLSMTGRDRIWAIAIEEWENNRLFGYGPNLWDAAFRASIGMPNATNAHNQFMDTLARSGSIGAVSLVLYAGVLLLMSIRYAKASGGLSLALFLALAIRSISEVPLMLFGYGTELFTHLLLIVTLAACAGEARRRMPVVHGGAVYGVPS